MLRGLRMVSVGLLIRLTLVLKWLWCEYDAEGHANAAKAAISAGDIAIAALTPAPTSAPRMRPRALLIMAQRRPRGLGRPPGHILHLSFLLRRRGRRARPRWRG